MKMELKFNKYLVIVDIAGYSLVGYIKCSVLCTQAKRSMNMDMNTVLWNNHSQLENSWITQLFHIFVSVFSAKMCNFVSTSKSVFLYSPVAICKTQTRCMQTFLVCYSLAASIHLNIFQANTTTIVGILEYKEWKLFKIIRVKLDLSFK